ncbi:RNA-binding KIN17-like [Octopus vulgaris]|uniref:RNA-binding KIN17-like n=1 Tax=Octopus vulgaris TaxID=6645 RepID=A0AA36AUU5_OCTVU|nr:RNA-binding KIN17-like [Octopus vulgaris]
MGKEKHGFLTPKAIANRIKAKGLQKLKWYCQMCEKQCRDENGFKCHMMSESHQRQLLLFAENPDDYIDTFSKDFLDGFLEVLRRRFGTKRVHANIVYQEYITDRHHIHMNSTQWETLTDFVKWTGKEGYCVVDYTEKGWFCQYVDRTPETIRKQEAVKAKERMDMDDEERNAKFIEKQIQRASVTEKVKAEPEYTELKRECEEKVTFNLGTFVKKKEEELKKTELKNNILKKLPQPDTKSSKELASASGTKRKSSALDDIMKFEEMKREKMNRKDNWLDEGIVVKVITKKLGDKYYKRKAVVKQVENLFMAVVKMLDTGDKVRLDQSHLETVIPALGKTVKIVNGAYRGTNAVLQSINEKKFCATVAIKQGPLAGRVLEGVQYEDISKLYQPT